MRKTLFFLLLLSLYVVCSTSPEEAQLNIKEWTKLIQSKSKKSVENFEDTVDEISRD